MAVQQIPGLLWQWTIGHGLAKVGRAIRFPPKLLHASMAVGIPQRVALNFLIIACVIYQQVGFAIRGGGEAVVSGAELAVGWVAFKNGER